MSNSGFPSTTMMSASLPGSMVPSVFPSENAGVDPSGGRDGALRRHADVHVGLDLSPQRLGVEVHRRARVGSHAHRAPDVDPLLQRRPFAKSISWSVVEK